MTRRAKVTGALLLGLLVLGLGLEIRIRAEPFPEALRRGRPRPSLEVFDRDGSRITELTREGERAASLGGEIPPNLVDALLSAEDSRFFLHPGVDPLAMVRAFFQAIAHGRLVSGASTITQQLARTVVPRQRTLGGKLREMIIALRIERTWDKGQILRAYLDFVEFGPRIRGVSAASRHYLDKPVEALDVAEAALLVGLARGPSYYNPKRGLERATIRRSRILDRMVDDGSLTPEEGARAKSQPVRLIPGLSTGGAEHLARALLAGHYQSGPPVPLSSVVTTLDGRLQADVEALTRSAILSLSSYDVTSAAVLVVDHRTSEVLAYVGSPDFWSEGALGQNDGTRARRQPGSALKPFVYAAGMERLGYSPRTLLPDIELSLPTPRGSYSPKNYDGRFHGPVRLRQALASSLNVPAVVVADRVGPSQVLEVLHRFGFESLDRSPGDYGAAIALGDGEVTLAELAAAYAALARGGEHRPLAFVRSLRTIDGRELTPPEGPRRRALSRELTQFITDMLADPAEREAGFGRNSVLDLPLPVAVKTGTSKGYRDNWTIGYSSELVVAVWVGNFDGRPMRGTSGVTGAGPLFASVMLRAMQDRTPLPLDDASSLPTIQICPQSGQLRGPECPEATHEHVLPGSPTGETCDLHVRIPVVPSSGKRAGPNCALAVMERRERYSALYADWAKQAKRPIAPSDFDPRCPGDPAEHDVETAPVVVFPANGAKFTWDQGIDPLQQKLWFRARAPRGVSVTFELDGRPLGSTSDRGELAWPIERGGHVLVAVSGRQRSTPVRFVVD